MECGDVFFGQVRRGSTHGYGVGVKQLVFNWVNVNRNMTLYGNFIRYAMKNEESGVVVRHEADGGLVRAKSR